MKPQELRERCDIAESHMLRAIPDKLHDEITAEIDKALYLSAGAKE
jgi:hypothetical protein